MIMDHEKIALLGIGIVLGSITALGGMHLDKPLEGNNVESNEDLTFVTPGIFHGNVYQWGFIRRSNMTSPMRIREMSNSEWVATNFIEGKASMAEIWWHELGRVSREKKDARIVPYQVNVPDEFMGIYVPKNSSIEQPEDLDGKNLAYPVGKLEAITAPSRVFLKKEYGVSLNLTVAHNGKKNPRDPVELVKNRENVDAVLITGTKRLGDNHSLRPVYFPFKEMEEKFGDSALVTFFMVENDTRSVEKAIETMNALQRSSQVAELEHEKFMEYYTICNEFMVQNGSQIERMTPGAEKQLQYFMEGAYEQGLIDQQVNVSKLMLEVPEKE